LRHWFGLCECPGRQHQDACAKDDFHIYLGLVVKANI
jgi:hypothetical protein